MGFYSSFGSTSALDNLVAVSDPTVNDDVDLGYTIKSLWFNTSSGEIFMCLNATDGAAVWAKTSLTIDELGSMALQNVNAVNIDGGTIDGTDVTVGAGKTLDVSAGTLTLANDQISGDKVEGGTINAVTINTLTSTTANATTFDTNVAAAGVTLSGTTLAADGTDVDIDITLTPKGTGEVNISKIDADGGTIDGTTIGGTTPAAVTGTTVSTGVAAATSRLDISGVAVTAAGSDADIDITFTPKGTGEINLPKVDIDAGDIAAAVTITRTFSGTTHLDLETGVQGALEKLDDIALYNSAAEVANNLAVGLLAIAKTGFTGLTVLGHGANINGSAGNQGTAVGWGAACTSSLGNAFGYRATADVGATAIGMWTNAGSQAVVIGGKYVNVQQAKTGTYSITVGVEAANIYNNSIVIARGGASTATNQMVVGSDHTTIEQVYLGRGVTSASAAAIAINPTGASGTDVAGVALRLVGGKATGSAAGGAVEIWTSDAGGSGTTLQTATKKYELPKVDGTAGQAMTTDGAGAASWTTVKDNDTVNAAGVTPVDTDVTAWANGTKGIVVGTGGRVFLAFKNATDVYYVEMGAI